MKKILLWLLFMPLMVQGQTLEQCQQAAEQNYPLIKQYDLIAQTTALTVSNIMKSWLPQLTASAQATYQNKVVSFPEQMTAMYTQAGINMKGLRKEQYRMGVDLSQTLYDGGIISSEQAIARHQGRVQEAQNAVDLYNVRQRVNEMYFALLLIDDQLQLNADLDQLLMANEKKLGSMVKNGTAAASDLQNISAERLNTEQQQTILLSQKRLLQQMLSTFCGIEVTTPRRPKPESIANTTVMRPELKLMDAQTDLLNSQEHALNAALKPRLGLFAQGYYGYPGYNMFEDMTRRNPTVNFMVGARLTWNIGNLYTRKNDKAKIELQRNLIENNREVFLFNTGLEQMRQREEIKRYEQLIGRDDEIISLRMNVRKAAESKLAHGIIDVNDLLREINQENAARLQKSMHEIEMLRQIYEYKYTTNN